MERPTVPDIDSLLANIVRGGNCLPPKTFSVVSMDVAREIVYAVERTVDLTGKFVFIERDTYLYAFPLPHGAVAPMLLPVLHGIMFVPNDRDCIRWVAQHFRMTEAALRNSIPRSRR